MILSAAGILPHGPCGAAECFPTASALRAYHVGPSLNPCRSRWQGTRGRDHASITREAPLTRDTRIVNPDPSFSTA